MRIKRFVKNSPSEAENEDQGKMSFIASTDNADRYGDVINQRGWLLDAYEKNNIVLLNHDHQSLPIGKGNVHMSEDGLVIDVEFDMEDPKAAEIARKAARGFMNAVSVGFAPKKSIARAELPESHFAYSKSGGQYFENAELLEVSIVTIPANADAVAIAAKSFGFDLKAYIQEQVRGEVAAMPIPQISKHIIDIQEDENSITITFAKPESIDPGFEEEEIIDDGYNDSNKEEEDEEMKALVKALLTHEGDY